MKKKQGNRNRKNVALYPNNESPKQKWQICEYTTRIIVNPRIASIYAILCFAIATAKVAIFPNKKRKIWKYQLIFVFLQENQRL